MKDKKILIVDDAVANLDILVNLLVDYDVIDTTNGQDALEILASEAVDLILLDIMMPDMDGYEVCQRIKQNPKNQDIPIIFITAKTEEDDIEKAFLVGGKDYITKPFKSKEILARVKTQLEIRSLIADLEYNCAHDQLTGIYNRRKFFKVAEEQWLNSAKLLHAAIVDIDKFKSINDTYGHPVGDLVLKKVAELAKEKLKNHLFARFGGEEFVVLFFNCTDHAVMETIEQLRLSIAGLQIQADKDKIVQVTISTGIAGYQADIHSLDDLLRVADEALYQAKTSGRNRTVFNQ